MKFQGARTASSWYPWIALALLWAVSFVNQSNRSILVATMPAIRDEFALSATQLALLNSVFMWTYGAAAVFAGMLGDSMSRSKLIILGLIAWSLVTGVVPLATSFTVLLLMRSLVGLTESTYYPAGTALLADWFPINKRSRTLALHQTATAAGAGIGAIVAAAIADQMGWRAPFYVFGVLGLILAVVLVAYLRDKAPIMPMSVRQRIPIAAVLRNVPALYLCGVFFFANGAVTGTAVWAPTFVHDALGFNLAGSSLYGSAPIYLAGFVIMPLGGLLGDWMMMRTPVGRLLVLAGGLLVAAVFLFPIGIAASGMMVAFLLLVSSGGKGLFDGCIYAAMQDVVQVEARASAVGLMTALGFLGAGLAPLMVAQIGSVLGMRAGMTSLAGLYVAAIVLLLLSLKSTKQLVLGMASQAEQGS